MPITAEFQKISASKKKPIIKRVLMVGTSAETMGGISTVVRGYLASDLGKCIDYEYITTHRDGSWRVKLGTATLGISRLCWLLLSTEKFLIHIHLSSRASFWRKSIVCVLARLMRHPYILHLHGSEFMEFHSKESGVWAQRFIRWNFAHAARVLALSQDWRDKILQICPDAAVLVLPNAVTLPNHAAEQRTRLGNNMTILFSGRLGLRKGVFDLIKSFAEVSTEFPQARLICAGDGDLIAAQALIAELKLERCVSLTGWIDSKKIHELYASAAIFVLPSYAEGLPMALLEAMSWALPVITTPVGGIPTVIQHKGNGMLVAPGAVGQLTEALRVLLASSEQREILGRAARQTIERDYSLSASVERLIQYYFELGVIQKT
jgi:glycosyltransferase involved in cell wall biosynthesis